LSLARLDDAVLRDDSVDWGHGFCLGLADTSFEHGSDAAQPWLPQSTI